MTPPNAKRWALPVSLGVIVISWAYSGYAHLFKPGSNAVPPDVAAIAVSVCVKAVVVLVVAWLLLAANGERLSSLGFTGPALKAALVWGPLLAAGVFLFTNVVLGGALRAMGTPARPEALPGLFRDPRQAPLWVFAAVVGGGFAEELLRAFVLTRFDRSFGRIGLAAAVVVDSVVFGLGHLYQGVTAAIQSGITGFLFALVFLWRRRAADSMVVHAIFDLLGIALAYFLYAARR